MLRQFVAQGRDKTPSGDPLALAVVRKLVPAFAQVPPSTWRKKLAQIRADLGDTAIQGIHGVHGAGSSVPLSTPFNESSDTSIHRMCTPTNRALANVGAAAMHTDEHPSLDTEDCDEDDESETDDMLTFKPIYTMGIWESRSEDRRVSIAIHLPSGMCTSSKDHSVRVSDDGMFLEISAVWPEVLTDTELLHKTWIEDGNSTVHVDSPRVISFRAMLRKLRKSSSQDVVSHCKIALPFKVKSELRVTKRNTNYLKWNSTNATVMYVTLEAPDINYIADKEESPPFRSA
eukprot:IDg13856t1